VDGLEALATGFLRFVEGFLWFFLWLETMVNPFDLGLPGVGEVRVFKFEG